MPTLPAPIDEHLLLTGFFSLEEYLQWRTLMAPADDAALLATWRRCSATVAVLEDGSAPADQIRTEALPAELLPRRDQLLADASVQRNFGLFAAEIAMVELNRLVLYQRHVNLAWAEELRQRWLALSTIEERFSFCLSPAMPAAPVHSARLSHDSFVFTSPSQDLRVQEILSLNPAQLQHWTPQGPPVAVVGAAIGFGSNCLQAIQWGSRLILANGTHRAFALRCAGEEMAPCLIQRVESAEELAVVAPVLQESGPSLLTATRPPLLQDLFHPDLTERLQLPRRNRQVRVTISVEELDLPG